MAETSLNVKLIAHTQLSDEFWASIPEFARAEESKVVALSAIRCCYSHLKPSEIVNAEGEKYFNREATDGEQGTEADRLIRHIMRSKHLSTVEHLNYTFAVEGLSRSALAQLTRHRHMSFSVQSQRYCRFGSDDKSGGFNYVVPPSVKEAEMEGAYHRAMYMIQGMYDYLREAGIPAEDSRFILSNSAATNLVMTANLRSLLDFYSKRKPGRGAQWEIAELAERIREEVCNVDPWTTKFFDEV